MDDIESKLHAIESSVSLRDEIVRSVLPEPNTDNGYYLVYYPDGLYKAALTDILRFSADNLRIWYDRHLDGGTAWEEYILEKTEEYDCIGVVMYINEEALLSPFFYALCKRVHDRRKHYCTVNYDTDEAGNIVSGAATAKKLSGKLSPEAYKLYRILFDNAVTYIRGDAGAAEKIRAVRMLKRDDVLRYRVTGGEATVVSVKDSNVDEIVVPAETEIEGVRYPVTRVAALAFANCRRLRSVAFPDSLKEIGTPLSSSEENLGLLGTRLHSTLCPLTNAGSMPSGYVFYKCRALKKVILPQSTERIYADTFAECYGLKYVDLGGVKRCSPYLFGMGASGDDEWKLERITFSSDVLRCGDRYFTLSRFAAFDIPSSVKVTDGYAPFEIREDMRLPDGVKCTLGILSGSKGLRSLVLPASYRYPDTEEFAFCPDLESVVFECDDFDYTGTHYNGNMFVGCRKLKSVSLPRRLTSLILTDYTGCVSLSELRVPSTVMTMMCAPYMPRKKRVEQAAMAERDERYADTVYIKTLVMDSDKPFVAAEATAKEMRRPALNVFHPLRSLQDLREYELAKRMLRFWEELPYLETIYLPRESSVKSIPGFVSVPSDREGYVKFALKKRKRARREE